MKRVAFGLAMLGAVALAGCASKEEKGTLTADKPLDKMSTEEWCGFYARYVKRPGIPEATRQADLAKMRARGCPAS